jgi:DNA repair protein RadC
MRPDSTRTGPCLLPDYRAVMEAFANYVSTQRPLLQSPEDTARLMRPILTPCEQEQMHALLLDAKNGLIADAMLTMGLADRTQIHPREAFREAVRLSCSRLILVHGHPSGDPTPSAQDIAATRQLVEAGKIIGIEVLDHIVLGTRTATRLKDFVSFRQENLL